MRIEKGAAANMRYPFGPVNYSAASKSGIASESAGA